jgi:hypothetical protein
MDSHSPPVPIFPATILVAEVKCSYSATSTIAELTECAAATAPETTTVIPPDSPIIAEGPKPGEPNFRPLFQVWHERSLCSALP